MDSLPDGVMVDRRRFCMPTGLFVERRGWIGRAARHPFTQRFRAPTLYVIRVLSAIALGVAMAANLEALIGVLLW